MGNFKCSSLEGVENESKIGEHQIGRYLKARSNWKDVGDGWEQGLDSYFFAAYGGGYGIINGISTMTDLLTLRTSKGRRLLC